VVLDTNVVVSAYLSPAGTPGFLLSAWRGGSFELVVSPALLAEYEELLVRDRIQRRHQMTREQITAEVATFGLLAVLVRPAHVPRVIVDDPDDDQVLVCAVGASADFIVSGDRHLLELRNHLGIRILRPAAFVALLERLRDAVTD